VTQSSSRSAWLAAGFVFVAALTLYVRTLAPSITWAHSGTDGGDLISAAATLGVPHPPGYPTYTTLGYLFSKLPIGDVAYRLNLMSAIFTALAATLITVTIIRQTPTLALPRFTGEGIGVLAGLSFATAPMVWGQATIAEVHGLNAFFVALILFLIAPIIFQRRVISGQRPVSDHSRLIIASFVWGIACGNLLTVGVLLPLMIVAWRRTYFRPPSSAPRPPIAFLIGLSIYWLIPLRAISQPPINWGNAVTFENFWNLITARLYGGYVLALPLSDYPSRLIAFGQLIVAQFGWIGVTLGAIGIWRALGDSNKNWRWLILPIALYLIFAFTYNTLDADLYLIPVWLFASWAIARGALATIDFVMQHAARITSRFTHYSLLITSSLILFVSINTIITHFSTMDLSQDFKAREFIQELEPRLPRNAIILTDSDARTFTLWYYRAVEGWRPDAAVIDSRLAAYADWYNQMVVNQGSAPNLVPFDPEDSWQQRLRAANPDRPLCKVNSSTSNLEVTCD
jgi:hypothetical protein